MAGIWGLRMMGVIVDAKAALVAEEIPPRQRRMRSLSPCRECGDCSEVFSCRKG